MIITRTKEDFIKYLSHADFCRKTYRLYYDKLDNNIFEVGAIACRCKRMNCPTCLKKYKIDLIIKLKSFCKRKHLRFMTLTYVCNSQEDINYAYNNYTKDFNKFITYLRRTYKKESKFQYFKIVEFTRKKQIHFHILIDSYIPKNLISKIWFQSTGNSFITDIRNCFSHKEAINYVLKYIMKSVRLSETAELINSEFSTNLELHYRFRIRKWSCSRILEVLKINYSKVFNKILFFAHDFINELSLIEEMMKKFLSEREKIEIDKIIIIPQKLAEFIFFDDYLCAERDRLRKESEAFAISCAF